MFQRATPPVFEAAGTLWLLQQRHFLPRGVCLNEGCEYYLYLFCLFLLFKPLITLLRVMTVCMHMAPFFNIKSCIFFFFHLKLSISSLKHSNLIGYIITCQHTIWFYIILLRKCPSICTSIVPLWLFIKNSLNMWLPTEVFIYSLLYEKVLGWSFSHCASGIVYCVICLVVIWVQTLNYYYSCFVSDIRFQFNCVLNFIQYI